MPRIGRTTAPIVPDSTDGNVSGSKPKEFVDKESQQMLNKIRDDRSREYIKDHHKDYNPKVDQQRIWSERSPAGFEVPFQSTLKDSHISHPQLKATKKVSLKGSKRKK